MEDRKRLAEIINEIDALHEPVSDVYRNPKLISAPNVFLPGCIEIIERSTDRERSGELFEEIHEILRKYEVNSDVYVHIGRAFEELGLQPKPDTENAIAYAAERY